MFELRECWSKAGRVSTSSAAVAGEDGSAAFGCLAGMLSHELRNPLTAAATNIAVANDLCDDSDPRAPFLRRAEHELDRIATLLRSCLALARAGRVERVEADIVALVEAAVREHQAAPLIELEVPRTLAFPCDPMLIERALANLCDNAARALGARQGRVRVTVELQPGDEASATAGGGDLLVAIEDSGPGVDPEVGDRVFEPFVSAGGGTGLGLAFVRQVARAHGGDVSLTPSALGGARFELRLPWPVDGV